MVAYNFKREFMRAIRDDKKRSTIRPNGKRRHARPGERVQLYTGMRTKHCQLLHDRECLKAEPIDFEITASGNIRRLHIDGQPFSVDKLAKQEGFESAHAMGAWFHDQYGPDDFQGTIIVWGPS